MSGDSGETSSAHPEDTSDDEAEGRPPFDIVVGGSAGGLSPLEAMLEGLPSDFDVPIVVAIHTKGHRPGRLADLLSRHCRGEVVWAADNVRLQPGFEALDHFRNELDAHATATPLTNETGDVRCATLALLTSTAAQQTEVELTKKEAE